MEKYNDKKTETCNIFIRMVEWGLEKINNFLGKERKYILSKCGFLIHIFPYIFCG